MSSTIMDSSTLFAGSSLFIPGFPGERPNLSKALEPKKHDQWSEKVEMMVPS